jgi:hypothetical protein
VALLVSALRSRPYPVRSSEIGPISIRRSLADRAVVKTNESTGVTTITWKVTYACKKAISYIAFGTSGLEVISPKDEATVSLISFHFPLLSVG